tara:strand:+ start:1858 stop:2085 length:228 start_codon:yes stop_codon:yes gene_type:complete
LNACTVAAATGPDEQAATLLIANTQIQVDHHRGWSEWFWHSYQKIDIAQLNPDSATALQDLSQAVTKADHAWGAL